MDKYYDSMIRNVREHYDIQDDSSLDELIITFQDLLEEYRKQEKVIDKAIEYIRENDEKYYQDWGQDDCSTEIYLDEDEVFKLLKILEDKEV